MNKINTRNLALGMFAYVCVCFLVQALSHFVINKDHFSSVSFMRKEPIMILGIIAMFIQGIVLAYLYQFMPKTGKPILQGIKYGLIMGIFLVSYIALVEPDKYMAPSVLTWILVEGSAGFVQFSLFGILLGIIHRNES